MTLVEKCKNIERLINECSILDAKVEQANNIQNRIDELTPFVSGIEALNVKSSLFVDNRIIIKRLMINTSSAIGSLEKVRDKFREAPQDITKGKVYTTLLSRLEVIVTEGNRQLTAYWRKFVDDKTPKLNDKVIELLGTNSERERISVLRNNINEKTRELPNDEEHVATFLEMAGKLQKIIEGMKLPDDIPPEVNRFLQETKKTSGATLRLFTPTVKEWLQKNNLETSFVIRSVG